MIPSIPRLCVRVAALTHPGLVRATNEDAVLVGNWMTQDGLTIPWSDFRPLDRPLLCAVADGLGGHGGGDIASRLALQELGRQVEALSAGERAIETALRAIHRQLRSLTQPDGRAGPGCTIAGFLLEADGAWVFNVGDSRVYRLREGFLTQVTTDDVPHPLYGNAGGQRLSHRVSQCLGVFDAEPEPHVQRLSAAEGDGFLLCSDGLTTMLDLDRIEAILAEKGLMEPRSAVAELTDQALAAGGEDNLTIVLIGIESEGREQGDRSG